MKLISLFAAVLMAAAMPDPASARTLPRDAIRACDQQAEYAEALQQLRKGNPGFTKRVALDVARGETPHPAQRRMAETTVERVFAFPVSANPIVVANEVGRRCVQAANAAIN